jgi:hypothetical protein
MLDSQSRGSKGNKKRDDGNSGRPEGHFDTNQVEKNPANCENHKELEALPVNEFKYLWVKQAESESQLYCNQHLSVTARSHSD